MPQNSSSTAGKLLIVAMLLAGVLLAGFSWWFRYAATHQVAQFWGPDTIRLIRDAPRVEAYRWTPDGDTEALARPAAMVDATRAPGMVHLRYALLEDRSFDWDQPADPLADDAARYGLRFVGPDGDELWLLFSPNCDQVHKLGSHTIGSTPIADGLKTIFAELLPDAD